MKASIRRNYCSPSQIRIEQIEKPIPKVDEVLIRVYASTVNRTDCANLTAKPFIMRFVLGLFKPRKIILGTDFAGQVISIGKNVKSFNIGDRVFGFNDTGAESQAEYITTTKDNVFSIPENIDYKQAAASIEGAHYAYSFIHKVNIKSGQSILINGATGGIGSALLQFVRQYDIKITATCNTKNITLIQSLGADKIFDYTKEDFTDDNDKYDFVYDGATTLTFYVDGQIVSSTAASVYWGGSPACGQNGSITVTKDLGSVKSKAYTFSVRDQTGWEYWSGVLNFTANTCEVQELTW